MCSGLMFVNTATSTEDVNLEDDSILDSDNDGLTNAEEEVLNTDPNSADTDRDRISDFDEVREHKTNPNSQDTDRDGYSDTLEIEKGFDPLEP